MSLPRAKPWPKLALPGSQVYATWFIMERTREQEAAQTQVLLEDGQEAKNEDGTPEQLEQPLSQ